MVLTEIFKQPQPQEPHDLPCLPQGSFPAIPTREHLYKPLLYTQQQELLSSLAQHSSSNLSILIKLALSIGFISRSGHVGDLPSGPGGTGVTPRSKSSATWDDNCVKTESSWQSSCCASRLLTMSFSFQGPKPALCKPDWLLQLISARPSILTDICFTQSQPPAHHQSLLLTTQQHPQSLLTSPAETLALQ